MKIIIFVFQTQLIKVSMSFSSSANNDIILFPIYDGNNRRLKFAFLNRKILFFLKNSALIFKAGNFELNFTIL